MVERVDFAIYIQLAYSPGNELGILRTKIEDKDCFVHGAKIKRLRERKALKIG
jgi:hypothetical protein